MMASAGGAASITFRPTTDPKSTAGRAQPVLPVATAGGLKFDQGRVFPALFFASVVLSCKSDPAGGLIVTNARPVL